MGALQGLNNHRAIESIDYVSTVSGGGYAGTCMTVAMSEANGTFPFGDRTSVQDSPAVGHLRNYSNYLLPRAHDSVRNIAEATVIILRGLVANAALVLTILLGLALITTAAFPNREALTRGSFVVRLLDFALLSWWSSYSFSDLLPGQRIFGLTIILLSGLVVFLFYWARHRSLIVNQAGDTKGPQLFFARWLFVVIAVMAFFDLMPVLIEQLAVLYSEAGKDGTGTTLFNWLLGVLAAVSGAVGFLSSKLGSFLKNSEHATKLRTLAARVAAKALLFGAALALPILLLAAYLYLSAWSILDPDEIWNPFFANGVGSWKIYLFVAAMMALFVVDAKSDGASPVYAFACAATVILFVLYVLVWWLGFDVASPFDNITAVWKIYLGVFIPMAILCFAFKPNAYSLHQFYRDRLSKAFIFNPRPDATGNLASLDSLKLSEIKPGRGPYQIINAALNIQGSAEANRRGRNADFFIFTRDFLGSDLTLFGATRERTFASTVDMEFVDANLNLGCAMAISGAALSSNMGGQTVRAMSPTLALLNIRLGYWMRNPRDVARAGRNMRAASARRAARAATNRFARAVQRMGPSPREPVRWLNNLLVKFYLIPEMFNLLNESSRNILLTDGGHIENLGIYELLKRGCRLIIAFDAEADPAMSCSSLIQLERYARIDLGVRIDLPWEEIARMTRKVGRDLASEPSTGNPPVDTPGPHCAIGRILYDTGAEGILLYVKSSLSGDERDYVLDYKKRYSAFPHESTGDQFFSEEQFEVYRMLGFHAVNGFLDGTHSFAWSRTGRDPWTTSAQARAAVLRLLPTLVNPPA